MPHTFLDERKRQKEVYVGSRIQPFEIKQRFSFLYLYHTFLGTCKDSSTRHSFLK